MRSGFSEALTAKLTSTGVVAVLVVDDAAQAPDLARALLAGGVEVMELTLRTPAALEALSLIREQVPEMVAGMGTVLTPAQVEQVAEAGAAFAVAPGTNPAVIEEAQRCGLPFAPGVATPSDVERALACGCDLLKFFPAEASGGLSYLKSMAAPYAHLGVRYMPLGGLNAQNMTSYLEHPFVLALGGSWLATREAIRAGDWDGITALARNARDAVRKVRG